MAEAPARPPGAWERLWGTLLGRPLPRAALAVLALLSGAAVLAPLVANDRPYRIEAVDHGAWREALRVLPLAARAIGSAPAAAEGIDGELALIDQRLDTLRACLGPEEAGSLEALARVAGELSGARAAGRLDDARRLASSLAAEVDAVVTRLGSGAVEPRPVVAWPLLRALSGLDVFLVLLWLGLCTAPLWGRARAARGRRTLAVLAACALPALAWQATRGGEAAFDAGPWKRGIADGTLEVRSVAFPPLGLGFAETHPEERYRPPTWLATSEMDSEGRYVRGPRAPRPDPLTGLVPRPVPVEVRAGEPGRNAAWRHPLGTDRLGRDLLVRLLWGGRASLAVGLLSTAGLVALGVLVGGVAGYAGGRTDLVLSRVIEVVQSIPAFFLVLAAVALIPEHTLHPLVGVAAVIALVRWTGVARLVRGELLRLREEEFVLAARALGLSPARIVVRHLLPNALGPVLVAAAFAVSAAILTESAISFLGFGVRHPVPSWGSLISESRSPEHWWIQVFPGAAIFLTVLCTNVVGEGVRQALDPRGRRP